MKPSPEEARHAFRRRTGSVGSIVLAALLLAAPAPASAHFFVQSYTLPIPFWMYAWGAVGALFLSFIAIGFMTAVPGVGAPAVRPRSVEESPRRASVLSIGSCIALSMLVLCIVSGLAGRANSFDNFNMTFFWIVFVLGVPYLVALIGDFYSRMNPWEALVVCLERLTRRQFSGFVERPERWGHWPAVVLYLGFIAIELFGHVLPRELSLWLLVYSLLNLVGALILGRDAWFRQGEFFGVLLRILGRMAPVVREAGGVRLRAPFSGLLESRPDDMGFVVFVLFMLSSTAFDGLHATQPWVTFFWAEINPHLVNGLALDPREKNALSAQLYRIWQWSTLGVSPFVYLGFFAAVLVALKSLVRSHLSVRELAIIFVPSLVPIAFVYHVTHYFTLLLTQGGQIVRLFSDPLGLGWNIFGTAKWAIQPLMIDIGTIWHIQVGLILAGHIASVWVAHVQALTLFHSPRRAALSQVPMLVLMMLFTAFGLWILSLPLS